MSESNVVGMPPSRTYSVDQALNSTLNISDSLKEILIIGWDTDGELFVRSSRMSRRDALWLCEQAKIRTLNVDDYKDDPG